MNNRTLLIRSEASPQIGYGHAARDLALAEEWIVDGGHVVWWTSPDVPALFREMWENAGVTVHASSGISQVTAGVTVVDGPHYSEADFHFLRAMTTGRLVVVDDDGRFQKTSADLLINPNAGAEKRIEFRGLTCLGTDYTWIRREVRGSAQKPKRFSSSGRTLLVSFGGTMNDDQLLKTLEVVEGELPANWKIRSVVGQKSNLSGSRGSIEFLKDVKSMAPLFQDADLFLGAGGHSLWELSYHGVPPFILTIADNQVPGVSAWNDAGLLKWLGSLDQVLANPEMLRSQLKRAFAMTLDELNSWSLALQTAIDGAGATRVSSALSGQPFYLRGLRFSDVRSLWLIANETEARLQSYRSEPISWENHVEWFEKKLNDPSSRIWVAESEGRIIGIFRYQLVEEGPVIVGVQIAPEFRGRGFGSELIRRGSERAKRWDGVQTLVAQIKMTNSASRAAFEKAGYSQIRSERVAGLESWILMN